MRKVKWGVLGVAKIATEKVIPAMQKGEVSEIVGIASRDDVRAREAANALGIPLSYRSYEALLADPEIEAVYNPLPNELHVPWTVKALEAGKHGLCEKPVALNAKEAAALVAARDRAGKLVAEAFMVRYHPQWRRARALAQSGAIGQVQAIQTFFSYRLLDPTNVRNIPPVGGGAKVEEFPVCDQYTLQGDAFSRAVLGEAPPEFPIEDAVRNMKVIDAVFRSAERRTWETV